MKSDFGFENVICSQNTDYVCKNLFYDAKDEVVFSKTADILV